MNAWERRELQLANAKLREIREQNAVLQLEAKLNRAVGIGAIVVAVILLVWHYFGAEIALAMAAVTP